MYNADLNEIRPILPQVVDGMLCYNDIILLLNVAGGLMILKLMC